MIVLGLLGLFVVIALVAFLFLCVARRLCRQIRHRNQRSVQISGVHELLQVYRVERGSIGLDRVLLDTLPVWRFPCASHVGRLMQADDEIDRSVITTNRGEFKLNYAATCSMLERVCAVCLTEYVDGVMVRLLPRCQHLFHQECVDLWLSSHTTCPLCRVNLLTNLKDEEDEKPECKRMSPQNTESLNGPCCLTKPAAESSISDRSSCAVDID